MLRKQTEPMNISVAPSRSVAGAPACAGADARALLVVMTTLQGIVLPPRSPGPGRP
jgi:hypothetical protein